MELLIGYIINYKGEVINLEVTKKTKNNGILTIREIDYTTAKDMMVRNHYSKKWNTSFGKINFGIFRDGQLLGGAVFGNLMNPKSYKSITNLGAESVIELNRLWVDDMLVKNAETVFLSSCFKIIKEKYPHIKYVQSFADGRLGCGTIYKASNFKYFGYDKSLFFEDIETQEVFHKVPLENTKRPNGFLNKNRRYLDKKLKAFYVKTYRYIYPLDKRHKVELKEEPYPDYDKGLEYIKHQHGIGLLSRLYIMYKLIGDEVYADKALQELVQVYKENDLISQEVNSQLKNKSVIWFKEEYIKNENNLKRVLPN